MSVQSFNDRNNEMALNGSFTPHLAFGFLLNLVLRKRTRTNPLIWLRFIVWHFMKVDWKKERKYHSCIVLCVCLLARVPFSLFFLFFIFFFLGSGFPVQSIDIQCTWCEWVSLWKPSSGWRKVRSKREREYLWQEPEEEKDEDDEGAFRVIDSPRKSRMKKGGRKKERKKKGSFFLT